MTADTFANAMAVVIITTTIMIIAVIIFMAVANAIRTLALAGHPGSRLLGPF